MPSRIDHNSGIHQRQQRAAELLLVGNVVRRGPIRHGGDPLGWNDDGLHAVPELQDPGGAGTF